MVLTDEQAIRIEKGTPPLSPAEAGELMKEVPGWQLKDGAIEREIGFKDFREAMDFVNKVADIAMEQDHHPDICISYNRVHLVLSTHKIGGLSRNDFIVASKVNVLL